VDEAIRIASLVRKALATGDFLLQTFTSDPSEFSASLNSTTCAADPSIIHSIEADSSEAVLGLSWHPLRETLQFRVIRFHNVVHTRTGPFSDVAVLFDSQVPAALMLKHLGFLRCLSFDEDQVERSSESELYTFRDASEEGVIAVTFRRVEAVRPGAGGPVPDVDIDFQMSIFLRLIRVVGLLIEPYSADSSNQIVVEPASGENEAAKTP